LDQGKVQVQVDLAAVEAVAVGRSAPDFAVAWVSDFLVDGVRLDHAYDGKWRRQATLLPPSDLSHSLLGLPLLQYPLHAASSVKETAMEYVSLVAPAVTCSEALTFPR